MPKSGYRDSAELCACTCKLIAVRRHRDSQSDGPSSRTHLAVYVGIQRGRERQVLRPTGHGRIGGRQNHRLGHGQVRHPGSDRPLHRNARAGGTRQSRRAGRSSLRSRAALVAMACPGFELRPLRGTHFGRLPFLRGSRPFVSASPRRDRRNFQDDRRRRTVEKVGRFPQRRHFRVSGTSVAGYRWTSAATAQPESAAVDGRRRPPVGQKYWFRRVGRTLGGRSYWLCGRRSAVDVDRKMPKRRRWDTEWNYATEVGKLLILLISYCHDNNVYYNFFLFSYEINVLHKNVKISCDLWLDSVFQNWIDFRDVFDN